MNIFVKYLIFLGFIGTSIISYSQNSVGIGTVNPNSNAVLDLVSTNNNQGFLVPRLNSVQIVAMGLGLVPADQGMLVFNITIQSFLYWNGTVWSPLGGGDTDWTQGAGVLYNNSTDQIIIGNTSLPSVYKMEVETPADATRSIAFSVDHNYTGLNQTFGVLSSISNGGGGPKYGFYSTVTGNGSQTNPLYGLFNQMQSRNTETAYGIYNDFTTSTGAGLTYGVYNDGEDYNYFSGDVGIGTLVPLSSLHVTSSEFAFDRPSGVVLDVNAAPIDSKAYIRFSEDSLLLDNPFYIGTDYDDGVNELWGEVSYDFRIGTNDTERLRINAFTGNVGIGTNSPISLLHLRSDLYSPIRNTGVFMDINSSIVDSRAYIRFSQEDALFQDAFYIGTDFEDLYNEIWGETNLNFRIGTNNAERMRISVAGNVGIANTNPSSTLDVTGDIEFSGTLRPNNLPGTVGQVLTSQGTGTPIWTTPSSADGDGLYDGSGLLSGATTVTLGVNDLNLNLNSTGTFNIQDAGVDHFSVSNNGDAHFGSDVYWRDASTTGTILATMRDNGDDGRFQIYENGVISVDLNANTEFIFNDQELDRDFRVGGLNDENTFFVDAGTANVGIGTANPLATDAYSTINGVSNAKVLAIHATNTAQLDEAPAILELKGSSLTNDDEIGMINFTQRGTTQSYNFARISAHREDVNPTYSSLRFYTRIGAGLNEAMVINPSGYVGIGTNTPGYQLQLSTNSAAKPTSNAWTVASDARLKKDIKTYEGGLKDVLSITPVWFTYTGEAGMPNETGVGVIAQDLQKVAPYMVSEWQYYSEEATNNEGTTYLGVDNGAMTYMLINATKEQQEQIEELKKENQELKSELDIIKKHLGIE